MTTLRELLVAVLIAVLIALLVVGGIHLSFTGRPVQYEARLRLPDGSLSGMVIGDGSTGITAGKGDDPAYGPLNLATPLKIDALTSEALLEISRGGYGCWPVNVRERADLICLYADILREPGRTEDEMRECFRAIAAVLVAKDKVKGRE